MFIRTYYWLCVRSPPTEQASSVGIALAVAQAGTLLAYSPAVEVAYTVHV